MRAGSYDSLKVLGLGFRVWGFVRHAPVEDY
jgi:hypothetical protein